MEIKMVVGLGNPDKKYALTRHNLGYRVIEDLEKHPPHGAALFKPSGYMNSSGVSVYAIAKKKGFNPDEILIICDDFALPLNQIRIRPSGTDGGHNGLRSVLEAFGTLDVPRLRIGIGPVPDGEDPADFVLQRFTNSEQKAVAVSIARAALAVHYIVKDGLEKAMNVFNRAVAE
jgi:PTH1 family peptidyl-tRNA hydrolase